MKTFTINKGNNRKILKVLLFSLLLTCTGSLFAGGEYYLPGEEQMLINDGAVNSWIYAEVREREIVEKGDEIWCEISSGVRKSLYVTLIFSRNDFESYYKVEDNMGISCVVNSIRKDEHEAPVGQITTYYLECLPTVRPLKAETVRSDSDAPRIYQILEIIFDADFDTSFMENIDAQAVPYPEDGIFAVGDFPHTEGTSIVYKFICTYWGNSATSDDKKIFHDLLAIKTDSDNNIEEAYQYTLEWTNSPSLDLYHSEGVNLKLDKNLNIRDLNLINRFGYYLNEDAMLDNILFAYEQF
ncbi:MAG: hypothetical protein JEY99_04485 [Spirochaetales bacterium]|nr:hypothetical protein [Spirochaetales bacterium]